MIWESKTSCATLLIACVILASAPAHSQAPVGTQSQHPPMEQSQRAPSEQHPRGSEKTGQQGPHGDKRSNENSLTPSPPNQASKEEGGPAKVVPKNAQEESAWWGKFWYEIKITDVAIAIFTGLLVLSTVGLFWATNKTANAAKDSADISRIALETIEAPHIEVVDHEIRIFPQAAHDRMYPGSAPPPEIDLFFFNTGRSTAVIQSIRREMFVVSGMDRLRQPVFTEMSGHSNGRTVTAANTKTLAFTCRFDRSLTAEELEGIRTGDLTVFVLGEMIYDDRLDWQHTYNFLLAYVHASKSMAAVGTGANKHTKIKK